MPKSKTIEIDEIVTPEKSAGDAFGVNKIGPILTGGFAKQTDQGSNPEQAGRPLRRFPQGTALESPLTLKLTQWFMLLRSKSWGKFVIVPIIILGVLLVIPLGLIAILVLIIRSIFSSRRY